MPDMLRMPAHKQGLPMALVVLFKATNRTQHPNNLCLSNKLISWPLMRSNPSA